MRREYEFVVYPYYEKMREEWDDFVLNQSINGTFLHTRRFLNYHPRGRFVDISLVIKKGDRIISVVPACEINGTSGKEFFSHKGSTYGEPIIDKKYYTAENVILIVENLNGFLKEKYKKATMKITADIHAKENGDLLQYALEYCGFSNYVELNTLIDLYSFPEDVIQTFDRNKKRNIKKCEEHGLIFRSLSDYSEIKSFHDLLTINLSKYDLKPVHTAYEMERFRTTIIPNNVKFYGVLMET